MYACLWVTILMPKYMENPNVSHSRPIIKIAFSGNPNNSKTYLTGVKINAISIGALA